MTENGQFQLDEAKLENILLQESTRNTPVVVISIAGDFRKGKLTYFIKNFNLFVVFL